MIGAIAVLSIVAAALPAPSEAPKRIVAVGGAITETVYALGAGDRLAGVDTSSVFPPEAAKLPKVGYHRAIAAEGMLSLKPDLILASHDTGPPAVIDQLRSAGARLVLLEEGFSLEGVRAKVDVIAQAVGATAKAEAVKKSIEDRYNTARAAIPAGKKPKVMFVYAQGNGTLHVSGTGSAAAAMIELAGGENAVSGYRGYRPLTAESMVAAAPDVILVPGRALGPIGGDSGFLKTPGVSLTPAARQKRIYFIDDSLLLSFGPRLGEAVAEAVRLIHTVPSS